FDPEKAKWYNQQYLKAKTDSDLVALFVPVIQSKGLPVKLDYLKKVAGLIKERLTFPQDFWDQAFYFFEAPSSYDMQMAKKIWKEDTAGNLEAVLLLLKKASAFTSASLEKLVNSYLEQNKLGFGKIATPLRLLIVGSGMGPHLFEIMDMIGKEETLKRIEKGLARIGSELTA
ncbi:MAG TPA: glutamate--tRNA ligase, partial [Bacteroidales bacterium]|nr:glutamate--tRNA ligase [Bacteroidales bacterium]